MPSVRVATVGTIRKSSFISGTAKVLRNLRLPCVPNPRDFQPESEAETNTNPIVREISTHTSVPRQPRTGYESPVSVHEVFSSPGNADPFSRFAAARTLRVSNPDLHNAAPDAGSSGENDESNPKLSEETHAPESSSWFHDDDEIVEAQAQPHLPIQAPPQEANSAPAKQSTRAPAELLSYSTSTQRAFSLAHIVTSVHPSEHLPLPKPVYPADPHLSGYPLLTDLDLTPPLQGPYSRFPSPPAPNEDPTSKRISLLNWRPKPAAQAVPPVTDAPARTKARTDVHGEVILHRHRDASLAFTTPEEGVGKWRGSELFLPKRVPVGSREDVSDERLGDIAEEELVDQEEQEEQRLSIVEQDSIPCNPARLSKPFDMPFQPSPEVTKAVKRKAPVEDERPLDGASRATRRKRSHPVALRAAHVAGGRARQAGARGRPRQEAVEAVELPGDWDTTVERQMGMRAWRTWRMSLGAPFGVERGEFREGGSEER